MRIMMSAAGSPVSPGIIRHLQNILGHCVIGHDCSSLGFGASICNEFWASPRANDPLFAEAVNCIARDIYLPFLDEELGLPIDGMICSPEKTICIFTSKSMQQRELERRGLPVAPIVHAAVFHDAILKPERGRGGKGIFRTGHPAVIEAMAAEKGYIAQKYIFGDEYTVDALCARGGKLLYAVPRLRIQAKGVSTIGQIVMDPELIALTERVTEAFEFYGPINVQFIRDPKTWETYIIEVNARLSGSCMFTVMAGWDILNDAIRLHEGKPFEPPECVKDGMIVRRYYVEEEA